MAIPNRKTGWPNIGIAVERFSWLRPSLRRQEIIAGYLAILPWLLGFLFFSLGPIIASFILMFMKWEVLTPPVWSGLDNLKRLLADKVGWSTPSTTPYWLCRSNWVRLSLPPSF
jgi:ABC-type sugar transport system permease subunit